MQKEKRYQPTSHKTSRNKQILSTISITMAKIPRSSITTVNIKLIWLYQI